MTTTAQCPVCGAESVDALLCHADTTALERELGDVPAIVGELDTTLSKQARIGTPGAPGLARERTPINIGAMNAADTLTNVLGSWVIDVCGEDWPFGPQPSSRTFARDLMTHIPAIRRHPAVNELVDEITDAIRQARRAVDRPADRVYLGQCLLETPDNQGRQVTCLAELYARPQAHEVQCRVCGTTHEVGERRAWLLQRAADMIVTVREAAQWVGKVGDIHVTEDRIRGYLRRGTLGTRPLPDGVKAIRLGDLLHLVLDDGERKSA
jgi:hypothetical protein